MRNDHVRLKTRAIYANRSMVSITKDNSSHYEDSNHWAIGEGYDGEIRFLEWNDKIDDYSPDFTKEELIELAEVIIARWNEFIDDVKNGKVKVKS